MPCGYCHEEGHNYKTCSLLEMYPLHVKKNMVEEKKQRDRVAAAQDRAYQRQREYDEAVARNRERHERMRQERIRIEREREVRIQRRKQWCRQILAEMVTETTNIYPEFLNEYLDAPDEIMNMLGSREATSIIFATTSKLRESKKELTEIKEVPFTMESCPICMEDFKKTDIITTRCGHMFHGSCLFKHLNKQDNCPCCRGVLI